jgi:bacteriocin-like protein
MKKLKLDFQQLNAEVLTKSELKKIIGGIGGSGGDGGGGSPSCSSNQCSVLANGVTYYGSCGYTQYLTVCECITPYGDYYPNGGISHCSPQL